MSDVMQLANNPMMWILALCSIFIVFWQSWIYFRLAKNYVKATDILTPQEINQALKIGIISTIGPAVAVFTVAVVLIGLVGGPLTLSRVGVIGSAAFESLSASAGSGGTVGTDQFTASLLATAAWVMAIGGSGWLVVTFFITKSLDNTQEKIKKSNPIMLALIGSITPFMVFAVMGYGQVVPKLLKETPLYGDAAALVVGAVVMLVLTKIGQSAAKWRWLLEWAMGFAIIAAMLAGVLIDAGVSHV